MRTRSMEICKWGRFTLAEPTIYVLWKRFVQLICFWKVKWKYDTYWLQCGNPNCAADNLVNTVTFCNDQSAKPQANCPKCGKLNR